jgi:hypothetical protein
VTRKRRAHAPDQGALVSHSALSLLDAPPRFVQVEVIFHAGTRIPSLEDERRARAIDLSIIGNARAAAAKLWAPFDNSGLAISNSPSRLYRTAEPAARRYGVLLPGGRQLGAGRAISHGGVRTGPRV